MVTKKIHLSLLAKCMLIVAGAAFIVLIIVAVTISEIFFVGQMAQLHRHSLDELRIASDKIIDDPRPAKINSISELLDVEISYSGPSGRYRTSDDIVYPSQLDLRSVRKPPRLAHHRLPLGLTAFRHDGGLYFMRTAGAHKVLYWVGSRHELWEEIPIVLLGALLALVMLFAAVAMLLRSMLRPLREIAGKMSEVGESGGEKVAGPRWLDDEVAQLVRNFNSMRARVAKMLKSKETLLRDVSHEVRSPLARLRVCVEFIADAKIRAQMLEDITAIDTLAGELLDKARLEDGTRGLVTAEVELADLVRETAASYPDANQRNFRLELPDQGLLATADARLLSRAMCNLIDNSLKYSELDEGSILIKLLAQTSGGRKQAVLEVADRGPRIPGSVVKRLFESFYRPDGARSPGHGGFGLGLAIVASIARAHGGEANAASPNSGGLRCRITLPAA